MASAAGIVPVDWACHLDRALKLKVLQNEALSTTLVNDPLGEKFWRS
jgi:hypothetical protein